MGGCPCGGCVLLYTGHAGGGGGGAPGWCPAKLPDHLKGDRWHKKTQGPSPPCQPPLSTKDVHQTCINKKTPRAGPSTKANFTGWPYGTPIFLKENDKERGNNGKKPTRPIIKLSSGNLSVFLLLLGSGGACGERM